MDLAEGVLQGDPLAISKAISAVENSGRDAAALVKAMAPRVGAALRIGVTGPPGVGKSTFCDALTVFYRQDRLRVGVIAVDPSSAFTGGALLGDRIRMKSISGDPDVFMRSMATRGAFGGLARATQDAADVLDAAGFSRILVETVGVGQSEIEIARATDCVLVILSPESGDGIQAMKSGLMEIADILVINKADRAGADRLEADLRGAFELGLKARRDTPIFLTEAFRGKGVPEAARGIDAFVAERRDDGRFDQRRRENMRTRLRQIVEYTIQRNLWESGRAADLLERLSAEVLDRRRSSYDAAEALVRETLGGAP